MISHLIDHDRQRLARTAEALGLKAIHMRHPGRPDEHALLCGEHLKRTLALVTPAEG